MGDVVIVEAAEHVDYSVRFTDVGQKLVAKPLAFAGSFHQSGYVDNLHGGGYHALWLAHLDEFSQTVVGDGYDSDVRLYGAEREIGRLRLGVRQTVEEG